jgi:hypothetical protein
MLPGSLSLRIIGKNQQDWTGKISHLIIEYFPLSNGST